MTNRYDDIDTHSGYDQDADYHLRLLAIAEAATAAGFEPRPVFRLDGGAIPKVTFDFDEDYLIVSFGSTLYDENPTVQDLTWWDAWVDANIEAGSPGINHVGDNFATIEGAIEAAIDYLFGLNLIAVSNGRVLSGRLCDCGDPIAEHQTGEGPWTGFCANPDCKCESPTQGGAPAYAAVSRR
jgi:hypothetical protein